MAGAKWLNVAAVATWLVSGVYPLSVMAGRPISLWPDVVWIASFLVYGAAMAAFLWLPFMMPGALGRHFPVILAAIQLVSGLLANYLSGTYLGGTGVGIGLLVIVAAEIPYILSPRGVWTWLAVQTVGGTLMFLPVVDAAGLFNFFAFNLAMGGFQVFAAASSMLARRHQAAREELEAANAELRATRGLLAETSRAAERLRISRDLHDTLGHHLTALSLQLDVAARTTEGKAADHIRQAHAITRLLLADVRDVVSSLRDSSGVDVAQAIRLLAAEQRGFAIHLTLPDTLAVDDRDRAETIIRCVQELITNTARHSAARNLWIAIERRADGIAVDAHDDGRGAASIACGHGLTGMRERFAAHAGHVEFGWGQGAGFRVRGFLPVPAVHT